MPFCEHYGPDVDINTENSLDNSGSNETMQKVLALIVLIVLGVKIFENLNFCVLHPIFCLRRESPLLVFFSPITILTLRGARRQPGGRG